MCQLYLKKQKNPPKPHYPHTTDSIIKEEILCCYEKNSKGSERCITVFTVHLPLCSFKRVGDTDHAAHITYVCVLLPCTHAQYLWESLLPPRGERTEQGDFLLHAHLDACILYHVIKYACKEKNM